ncbi:MAG: MotA/TolQ/ExbB proton channel family protein [Pseudomonadota bacterium]|nr:MotA/TolQ/ExbB proton channel family protein [Pseudomonadota bacterium]
MHDPNSAWAAVVALPLHLMVTAGLLALLVLAFVGAFLLPGLLHWARLRRVQRALGRLAQRAPPGELGDLFARDARLANLWRQFQDSLHVQRDERDGQGVAVAVRSTLPAETFFNSQYVVDGRLRTEFFKHVPGIFTGIGIIGTFTGLIEGLRRFQVSENAATVRASLESLMHSVGEAFLVSASAIAAAMVVTFLEKLLLSALYARTEAIAHAIDARFDAGAGEDYLSRLVKASEDSAVQARSLKDLLVRDLAEVMRAQTERQIQGLAGAIGASIQQGLHEPLQHIAAAVRSACGDPGESAAQRLGAVLDRFGDRLDQALGSQAAAYHGANLQSGEAMQHTLQAMRQMMEQMAVDGRQSGAAAASQLQASLTAVGEQVGQMLQGLGDTQRRAVEGLRERERVLNDQAGASSEKLSTLLGQALSEMSAASTQMSRSVDALTHVTASALDKMNLGAERLSQASTHFAQAGERVGGVLSQAAQVTTQLVDVSGVLGASSHDLVAGLDDYRNHRAAIGHLVTELRQTVALAGKEASLTADVLQRIQASSDGLGQAQRHADQYLDSVSKVLGDAHLAFAGSIKKTLALANSEFHAKLATAVSLLSSTVIELEATLGQAAPQRH